MAPYEIKINSRQREIKPCLKNTTDIIQEVPAHRPKSVRFAPKVVDNEFNEFKTGPGDRGQENNIAVFNAAKDSKRERISSSSSEFYWIGSSCHDQGSTRVQSITHRTIKKKPVERWNKMEFETPNDTASQDRNFKLVASSTRFRYSPRVPSPPIDRNPPSTPRPARLPTPDFEDFGDHYPQFCDCLMCYEAEMSRHSVESRRGDASAHSKMEDQCKLIFWGKFSELTRIDQAATAYIRSGRPMERQENHYPAAVPVKESQGRDLINIERPRSVSVSASNPFMYDLEKVNAPTNHHCRC